MLTRGCEQGGSRKGLQAGQLQHGLRVSSGLLQAWTEGSDGCAGHRGDTTTFSARPQGTQDSPRAKLVTEGTPQGLPPCPVSCSVPQLLHPSLMFPLPHRYQNPSLNSHLPLITCCNPHCTFSFVPFPLPSLSILLLPKMLLPTDCLPKAYKCPQPRKHH